MSECVFSCCEIKIETEFDFEDHFRIFHFSDKSRKNINFKCPIINCNTPITCLSSVKRHFFRFHFNLIKNLFSEDTIENLLSICGPSKSSFNFCDLNNTPIFNDSNSFNYFSHESDYDNNQGMNCEFNSNYDNNQEYESNSESDSESEYDSLIDAANYADENFLIIDQNIINPKDFDLKKELADLILELKLNDKVNQSSIMRLIINYNKLLLNSSNSPFIDKSILNEINEFVKSPFSLTKTILEANNTSSKIEVYETNFGNKNYCICYLPIFDNIIKALNNKFIYTELLKERNRQPNTELLKTFKDGNLYLDYPDNDNEFIIRLRISFDDIATTKRSTKNNKLSVAKCTFNNLSLKFLAKLSSSFTILISTRNSLDFFGIENYFKPLFDEVDYINSQNYLVGDLKLVVKITTCSGDMLALNELMKITKSFRSSACQDCTVHYKDLNSQLITTFTPRTLDEDHVFKRAFNSTKNYTCDIFHLFDEGIINKLMSIIIRKHYSNQTQILVDKAKSIRFFNGNIERIQSNYYIKGTGTQIHEFFLYFPLIDDKVSRTSIYWQMYLLLKEIILFSYDDIVFRDSLPEFQNKCNNFLRLFFENFTKNSESTFTFKIHKPSHLKDHIEQTGPLLNFCLLRDERGMGRIKSLLHGSKNRKNVALSAAKWTELDQIKNLFCTDIKKTNLNKIPNVNFNLNNLIDSDKAYHFLKTLELPFNTFGLKEMYLYRYNLETRLPDFFKIEYIIEQEENIYILGLVYKSVGYDDFRCSFNVSSLNIYEILNVKNLLWHLKLNFIEDQLKVIDTFPNKLRYYTSLINENN